MTLNDNASIIAFLESFDKQAKALKEEALRLCWYMRGSIAYSEAMMLSEQERNIIGSIIKENLETTKTSGMPFF